MLASPFGAPQTAKDLAGRQRDILGIQPGGWFSSSVPTTDEELFTVDGLILEADLTIMEGSRRVGLGWCGCVDVCLCVCACV